MMCLCVCARVCVCSSATCGRVCQVCMCIHAHVYHAGFTNAWKKRLDAELAKLVCVCVCVCVYTHTHTHTKMAQHEKILHARSYHVDRGIEFEDLDPCAEENMHDLISCVQAGICVFMCACVRACTAPRNVHASGTTSWVMLAKTQKHKLTDR
jgi:hypothetical protein